MDLALDRGIVENVGKCLGFVVPVKEILMLHHTKTSYTILSTTNFCNPLGHVKHMKFTPGLQRTDKAMRDAHAYRIIHIKLCHCFESAGIILVKSTQFICCAQFLDCLQPDIWIIYPAIFPLCSSSRNICTFQPKSSSS